MRYSFVLLVLVGTAHAQQYNLKVIYGEVEDINEQSAILALQDSQQDDKLSSLCAYHIVHRDFVRAKGICDQAVETEGSFAAYNNRGVLRAKLGNFGGALEDFNVVRVLPQNQSMYVQQLARSDTRMIATSNHSVVQRLVRDKPEFSVKGADIEDIQ